MSFKSILPSPLDLRNKAPSTGEGVDLKGVRGASFAPLTPSRTPTPQVLKTQALSSVRTCTEPVIVLLSESVDFLSEQVRSFIPIITIDFLIRIKKCSVAKMSLRGLFRPKGEPDTCTALRSVQCR